MKVIDKEYLETQFKNYNTIVDGTVSSYTYNFQTLPFLQGTGPSLPTEYTYIKELIIEYI